MERTAEHQAMSAERLRCSHSARKTCIELVLIFHLAIAGILAGATGECARVEDPPHHSVTLRAQSVEELLPHIQYALKMAVITEKWEEVRDSDETEDPGIAPVAMAQEALRCAWQWCLALPEDPQSSLERAWKNVKASNEFLSTYRPNKEEAANIHPKSLRCNAPANMGCEELEQLGLPMYLLSIWPKEPAARFHQSWHQMAVCKMNDRCFLIVDNNVVTLWHGSLKAFVAQYGDHMCIISQFGIATYAEPKNPKAGKFLSQACCGIADEKEMESLNLPIRLSNRPFA